MTNATKDSFLGTFKTFSFSESAHVQFAEQVISAVQSDDGDFASDKIFDVFVKAAHLGLTNVVELFLKFNKDLIDVVVNGHSAIFVASCAGHVETVVCLIDNNCKVNYTRPWQRIPLLAAARHGHKKVVEKLLAAKANVGTANGSGHTPLYLAAINGHEKVVQVLLAANADVERADIWGETALFGAAHVGHEKVVKILLDAKASVDKVNKRGHTILFRPAGTDDEKVVRQLVAARATITSQAILNATPNTRDILARALEWRRLFEVAIVLHPLDLPVLVVHKISHSLWSPYADAVSRYCAWNLFTKIKRT